MKTIRIKPSKSDLIVPNPDNGFLALSHDGEEVIYSRYWKRRLDEGDVVTSKAPPKTSKSK
ncbi:MAG: DUF2635 domain-containing protein [Rickettsiales bacterium]|nr:DUF2635 domain-containing protein [Rickettsiales bacterium]|tara:strand:- start:754 stop:936 length:183 start_codon:yes stop_codon:yes gene_type:complete